MHRAPKLLLQEGHLILQGLKGLHREFPGGLMVSFITLTAEAWVQLGLGQNLTCQNGTATIENKQAKNKSIWEYCEQLYISVRQVRKGEIPEKT